MRFTLGKNMKKLLISCLISLFSYQVALSEVPYKAVLILTQAAMAAAQIGMVRTAGTAAGMYYGVAHMGFQGGDNGGGSRGSSREERERGQAEEGAKADEVREAKNRGDLAGQRRRNLNGLTDVELAAHIKKSVAEREAQNKEKAIAESRKNVNQMQQQVERGQAPKGIKRVDQESPNDGEIAHVHFVDGTSLNCDGSIHKTKSGTPRPTKAQAKWLISNGWIVPGFARIGDMLLIVPGVGNVWYFSGDDGIQHDLEL